MAGKDKSLNKLVQLQYNFKKELIEQQQQAVECLIRAAGPAGISIGQIAERTGLQLDGAGPMRELGSRIEALAKKDKLEIFEGAVRTETQNGKGKKFQDKPPKCYRYKPKHPGVLDRRGLVALVQSTRFGLTLPAAEAADGTLMGPREVFGLTRAELEVCDFVSLSAMQSSV
jgi:hypothetical protein